MRPSTVWQRPDLFPRCPCWLGRCTVPHDGTKQVLQAFQRSGEERRPWLMGHRWVGSRQPASDGRGREASDKIILRLKHGFRANPFTQNSKRLSQFWWISTRSSLVFMGTAVTLFTRQLPSKSCVGFLNSMQLLQRELKPCVIKHGNGFHKIFCFQMGASGVSVGATSLSKI